MLPVVLVVLPVGNAGAPATPSLARRRGTGSDSFRRLGRPSPFKPEFSSNFKFGVLQFFILLLRVLAIQVQVVVPARGRLSLQLRFSLRLRVGGSFSTLSVLVVD